MPVRIHVVSHTHWDREWYHPAGRFRQRLVMLVDELLDAPPPGGESFLLDGQAVVLEDYLEVRPERRGELSALLRTGALEAGPWFVLADELIPGAEALVRNMLAGRRSLRALRAAAPPVLYCPDSFGHPATLPILAAGFGLGTVILWRGYGGDHWPSGDSAWWHAGGERVLIHHLPPAGYEAGASLPPDEARARDRWERLRDALVERSGLGVALLPNGADHHARQPAREAAIRSLRSVAVPHEVQGSSLTAFLLELERAAAAAELPDVRGELRDSTGYTWSLQGTFASRAYQKRRNAMAERLLVRDAEPWAALARARGGAPRRALMNAAWSALLRCHPHDTLCGCSTDEVARAMDARLDDALSQGTGIREDAVLELIGHDRVFARERPQEWTHRVLVRNRSPRRRGGVAQLRLTHAIANVPVGPASAGTVLPPSGEPVTPALPLLVQPLHSAEAVELTESPRDYPRGDLVWETHALAWMPAVPGYGVSVVETSVELDRASGHDAPEHPVQCGAAGLSTEEVRAWLGNGVLRVECGPCGALHLTDHALGSLEALVFIEEQRDLGDLYTPSLRGAPSRWRPSNPRVVLEGPLRCAFAIRFEPESPATADDAVTAVLSLDAAAPFVRFSISGANLRADRRLRFGIATGLREAATWADAAFGPVNRLRPRDIGAGDGRERRLPTAPLHRHVSLFGGAMGVTLYSDGLAEYEATADGDLLVTLVRAVGELSRIDLPERPGHAGWPRPTPQAQCIGPFSAELALLLHEPVRSSRVIRLVEQCADDVLLPLTGESLRSALPRSGAASAVEGVELRGETLALSAIKDSDEGDWLVLRSVNLAEEPCEGSWRLGHPIAEACTSRLDETPGDALTVEDGHLVHFRSAPREVVTILVR